MARLWGGQVIWPRPRWGSFTGGGSLLEEKTGLGASNGPRWVRAELAPEDLNLTPIYSRRGSAETFRLAT